MHIKKTIKIEFKWRSGNSILCLYKTRGKDKKRKCVKSNDDIPYVIRLRRDIKTGQHNQN